MEGGGLPRWIRCGFACWIATFLVLAAINWHGRDLGYWWDAAGYVRPHTMEIFNSNLFPILRDYDVGHPTLFYFLSALMMKLFGPGVFGVHLLTWGFGALGIVAAYALARSLELPRSISVAVSVAFITFPLVWAQMNQMQLDLPYLAFGLAAIACWCREKRFAYFLFASGALLTKIYGFALVSGVVAAILLTSASSARSLREKEFWRRLLWGISPVFSLAVFLLVRYLVRGQGLTVHYVQPREIEPFWHFATMWNRIVYLWHDVYIPTGMGIALWITVLLVAASVLSAFWMWRTGRKPNWAGLHHIMPLSIVLLWTVALHAVILMAKEHDCARHFMVVVPLSYLAGVYALWKIVPRRSALLPILGLAAISQVLLWHPSNAKSLPPPLKEWLTARTPQHGWEYEFDLQYTDAIRLATWGAKRARKNAAMRGTEAGISTQWPIAGVLRDPGAGYVDEPMNVAGCTSWDDVDPTTHPYVIELKPIQIYAGTPPKNLKEIARRKLANVEVIVWRVEPRT